MAKEIRRGDPFKRGQDLTTLLGKVLRINPNDVNPQPEIYAYGFRNPWSLTFDQSGRGFIGDVGQDAFEEINLLQEGGNYGWSIKEGELYTSWDATPDRDKIDFIDPIYVYPHAQDGPSAVMGGYYVDNNANYADGYYFADISGSIIRLLESGDDTSWDVIEDWHLDDGISIYGWGYDGDHRSPHIEDVHQEYLYLLVSNQSLPKGQQGQVLRILKFA